MGVFMDRPFRVSAAEGGKRGCPTSIGIAIGSATCLRAVCLRAKWVCAREGVKIVLVFYLHGSRIEKFSIHESTCASGGEGGVCSMAPARTRRKCAPGMAVHLPTWAPLTRVWFGGCV